MSYFFFSYSRQDWDDYLQRFFDDLRKKIAGLKDIDVDAAGFRDQDNVETGEDWNLKISAAVQKSHVLVCIYSPRFFSKQRQHEFCAREFAAFLKRNPELRYRQQGSQDEARFQLQGARNIVPILWFNESDLKDLNDLPPYVVRSIQYAVEGDARLNNKYIAEGLAKIARRRPAAYDDLVSYFARLIVRLSAAPLQSLEPPPDVATLGNAFWDPPEQAAAKPSPNEAAGFIAPLIDEPRHALPMGPSQIFALEVRIPPPASSCWRPYAGGPCLTALVEEIAQERKLGHDLRTADPSAQTFRTHVARALTNATAGNARPILFVDPRCLAHAECRSALLDILKGEWRGGLLIPVDASDKASGELVRNFSSPLVEAADKNDGVAARISIGTIVEFRAASVSVVDDVLSRIVTKGAVQRDPPQNAGPSSRPMIANTVQPHGG